MKKKILVSTAITILMLANVLFPIKSFATSRTTTTELQGTGRTAEEAISVNPQVLGARRAETSVQGVTTADISEQSVITTLQSADAVAEIINNAINAGSTVGNAAGNDSDKVEASNLTVYDSMEITVSKDVVVSEANPLFLSFTVPGVTVDTRAFILHWSKNGCEVVPTTVSAGTVTGRFTSLSPVAIVVDKTTLNGSVLGASRKTSPRTGDDLLLIAIAGAAIVVVVTTLLMNKKAHD